MGNRGTTIILILLLFAYPAETPGAGEPGADSLIVAVQDSHGRPISDVVIELFRKPVRVPPLLRSQRKYLPREGRVEPDLVVTGAADRKLIARDLPTGVHALVVRAPGFASREIEVRWVSGDEGAEVLAIELLPAAVIEGRVLLLGGALLTGVEVLARRWADELDEPDLAGQFVSFSDELGRYHLAGLSPGYYELWTRRPGGTWVSGDLVRVPEIPRLDLELTDGVLIRGRVTDSVSGRPVPGAVARLLGDNRGDGPPIASATTDDDGRYLLRTDCEFAESKGLLITSDDHRPAHRGKFNLEYLRDREQFELDVALLPACRIHGRVIGPAGPVAGAQVTVWGALPGPLDHHEGKTTTTAEDGTWSLSGLAPGVVGVKAVADGLLHPAWRYDPKNFWDTGSGEFPKGARCRVEPEAPATFDVVLMPAPAHQIRLTLGGSVRDEAGKPIAFARVTANDSETTTTDRRGRFSFTVLCDSRRSYTELSTARQGYDRAHWSGTPTTDRSDIEMVVRRARVIRGRVSSKAGGRVAGAAVTVGREYNSYAINFMFVDTAWDEQHAGRVGADGTFEVTVSEHPDYRFPGTSWGDKFVVCVEAEGHRPAYSKFVTFEGESREAQVSLILEPAFELRGSAFSRDTGEALAGATVRLTRGPGTWPPKWPPGPWEGVLVAVTDATGDFVVRDLAPGRYAVDVSFPGLVRAESNIVVPTEEKPRYELLSYRSLGGIVLDPKGQPVAGARILLVDEETGRPWLTDRKSDAEGLFLIERVPDLSVFVVAFPDHENHPTLGPAFLGPFGGENQSLRLILPEGLEVRGQLLDIEGHGLPGVNVLGHPQLPFSGYPEDTTDEEGGFRLRRLAAEPYALEFREVGVTVHGVSPGTAVEFRLPGQETITGTVIRKDRAFGRLALEALPDDPRIASGLTFRHLAYPDQDGRFEFRHLAPGDYRIDIHPLAGELWSMVDLVEVPAGATDVRIRCRSDDD